MKLTVDIMEEFIAGLDLSGKVNSFSDDGTNTTILVDKTFHLRGKMQVDIDGSDHEVVNVVNNTSVEVAGLVASPQNYTVPNPFYFHGTPMATNDQIHGKRDANKVPMVYLYEILRERDMNIDSRVVRESDLRLFFLDNADYSDWETDDHYSKRLVGLNNLVDFFIEAGRADRCCFYLYETTFTRINHVKWGVWKNNAGHEKRLFDDNLTGVELSFTLPLRNCN